MKPTTVRTRTGQKVGAGRTRSEPCGVLTEKAHIPARCKVRTLPADFVPGYSFCSTVEKIRLQHSNYDHLLAELLLACRDNALAGRKCALCQDSALAPHWCRCPLLSPLRCELRRMADEKAEQAYANWGERARRERSRD